MRTSEREQEQRLERHHEMADRHQRGADHDGAALAEHAVGEQAADDRREIDERRCRGRRSARRAAAMPSGPNRHSSALLQRGEADARSRARSGCEQVLHHVEHEQRAHAVVGEALPHLGGEQIGQPARMAEQVALAPLLRQRPLRAAARISRTGFPGLGRRRRAGCAASDGGRSGGRVDARADALRRSRRRGRRRTRCRAACPG